jgi:hypothetical protein
MVQISADERNILAAAHSIFPSHRRLGSHVPYEGLVELRAPTCRIPLGQSHAIPRAFPEELTLGWWVECAVLVDVVAALEGHLPHWVGNRADLKRASTDATIEAEVAQAVGLSEARRKHHRQSTGLGGRGGATRANWQFFGTFACSRSDRAACWYQLSAEDGRFILIVLVFLTFLDFLDVITLVTGTFFLPWFCHLLSFLSPLDPYK